MTAKRIILFIAAIVLWCSVNTYAQQDSAQHTAVKSKTNGPSPAKGKGAKKDHGKGDKRTTHGNAPTKKKSAGDGSKQASEKTDKQSKEQVNSLSHQVTVLNEKNDSLTDVIRSLANDTQRLAKQYRVLNDQLKKANHDDSGSPKGGKQEYSKYIPIIGIGCLFNTLLLFFLYKLMTRKMRKNKDATDTSQQAPGLASPAPPNGIKPATPAMPQTALTADIQRAAPDAGNVSPAGNVTTAPVNAPVSVMPAPAVVSNPQVPAELSFSNVVMTRKHVRPYYIVVAASAIGKSHLTSVTPCQDYHKCEDLGNGWGIAITSDGAGSAKNSHKGSRYAVENALTRFKDYIIGNNFIGKAQLPKDDQWQGYARQKVIEVRQELATWALKNKMDPASVACTLTVVIYSPIGILITHVGDGRAGYCNMDGEWKPLMVPHKGEESNQTVFLTSDGWSTGSLMLSGVPVPESRVIKEQALAITLMSDGCESHSFDSSKMDKDTNKWHDPNMPFAKFFTPLVEKLKEMDAQHAPPEAVSQLWRRFVESGTPGLKDEPDDKTLVLGVLIK